MNAILSEKPISILPRAPSTKTREYITHSPPTPNKPNIYFSDHLYNAGVNVTFLPIHYQCDEM